MNRIPAEHLAQVGRFVSTTPARAVSIGTLARRLGTAITTAQRRLEAYAQAKDLELVATTTREGKRGLASRAWYLRPKASASAPAAASTASSPPPPARPAPQPTRPSPVLPTLALPAPFLATLTSDEHLALQHLTRSRTLRTSELAAALGRSPARVDGLMRALRRKLHAFGLPHFTDEARASGETLYRLQRGAAR